MRLPIAIVGVAVLGWVGWSIIQATRADELAGTDPAAALRIDPDHPKALLRLGRLQLDAKDFDAATATARHLLSVEPGQGDGFAILALAAVGRGDRDAKQLLEIAVQRAPRNPGVRTQAMVAALRASDLDAGMRQLDALLRLSPGRGQILFPAMAQQAVDPAFAEVLVGALVEDPPWRGGFLASLTSQDTPPGAMDRVYAGLQRHHTLAESELRLWLERMLRNGRWGEAYAHWVGTLAPKPTELPSVYNGGFERPPSNMGFDWHELRNTGVFTSIGAATGAEGGQAAHFHFIGRPTPGGGLQQPILLAPGRYRLELRAKAEFLHSEQGLQWIVRCDGGATVAELGPLEGSFGWQRLATEFTVPATACPGQWLELHNPAVAGSAQVVSGDLWIDDVAIHPL
ncbi:MAG: hypothetical protein EPO30_01685 [Lysobacteraceae bacterium]|nr:MAG: hypothetical protein EPO30_01685 [Xanthomonadaceae bacterium]